jgi:hypothetical protein
MCHGLCEIGATDFRSGMTEVADWLQAHPDEVISLVIEDHAPSDQIGTALDQAGIGPLALAPPARRCHLAEARTAHPLRAPGCWSCWRAATAAPATRGW